MPVRIVVADDHPVVLDGIRLMLDSLNDYSLTGVATSLKEIISVCANASPDVLILDLNIDGKNSLDLIPDLFLRHPDLKIIVFSAYQSTVLLKKGLEAGIKGYLLKDASKTEWVEALRAVGQNKIYLSKYLKTSVHLSLVSSGIAGYSTCTPGVSPSVANTVVVSSPNAYIPFSTIVGIHIQVLWAVSLSSCCCSCQ